MNKNTERKLGFLVVEGNRKFKATKRRKRESTPNLDEAFGINAKD
jgi:hypothetical protein